MLRPLKSDMDLSFLNGREIVQVAVGAFHVQVKFDDEVTISIEEAFSVIDTDGKRVHWSAGEPSLAAPAVALIGATVQSVEADGSTLTVRFRDGRRLMIEATESMFESYTITHATRIIVV